MAKIRVYRDETDGELLPPMCARCGAEPDLERERKFFWNPGWAHLFILLGLLPWLIAILITRKSMWVTLPLCNGHRNHWINRQLYVWLGFLFWVVFAVTLGIEWDDLPKDAGSACLGFLIFGGLIWLFVGLFYVNSAIKASRISDRWIELVGLNRSFAREWNASAEEEEEPRKKKPKRRDSDEW
jgi:hypothetical protein